MNKPKPLLD